MEKAAFKAFVNGFATRAFKSRLDLL